MLFLITTITIAMFGAYLGLLTTLPLAHLFGAALAVITYLKVSNKQITLPKPFITIIQLFLGLSIGITVDISTLLTAFSPIIIVGLLLCIISQITVNYFWLSRIEKWNPFDSLLGSIPGALGAIISVVEERGAPAEKIIFSHSVRLLILVCLAGFIAQASPPTNIVTHFQSQYIIDLICILIVSLLGGNLLKRIKIPASYILSSLITTILYLHIFSINDMILPPEFMLIITAILGLIIGVRLADTTLKNAIKYSKSGIIITLLAVLVSVIFALLFSSLTGLDWKVLLLAWLPGSVEAMVAVALLLNLEAAFVAINHVMRLLVLFFLPLIFKKQLQTMDSINQVNES
ncbi:AbrB family transcriptional regulator [Vibrio sp. SS-MA-C1-2]|uniref:AbrB family transcriptional regulator n=1 Tax=Vibrio sp. SS-MA-C1-2 TaxID=2908646 RepID=UPI001F299255|nr:AbrB family transcriptional regulator [Vibrio sp. SS-MA-C1-2]UJF20029.1 AbrB family transcriptional regulator [Vibrio sp. SS-MA-C1-2]